MRFFNGVETPKFVFKTRSCCISNEKYNSTTTSILIIAANNAIIYVLSKIFKKNDTDSEYDFKDHYILKIFTCRTNFYF